MSVQNKKNTSWTPVILWLIFFWPVGIYFLIRRLNTDKSASMTSGNAMLYTSYGLIAFGVVGFFAFLSDAEAELAHFVILALFAAGGIYLYPIAKKAKKEAERNKKYIAIVVNGSETVISRIASAAGVSESVAINDLQNMIDKGYFEGAYINLGNRTIVMPERVLEAQTGDAVAQTKVVACSYCGANNRVAVGRVSDCEYCSMPLK